MLYLVRPSLKIANATKVFGSHKEASHTSQTNLG